MIGSQPAAWREWLTLENGTWLPELAPTSPSLNVDRAIKTSTYGDPARNIRSRTLHLEISSSSLKFQVSAWKSHRVAMISLSINDIIWLRYHKFLRSYAKHRTTGKNPCKLPVISEVLYIFYNFIGKVSISYMISFTRSYNFWQERLKRVWYHNDLWYHIWYHTKTYDIMYDIIVSGPGKKG